MTFFVRAGGGVLVGLVERKLAVAPWALLLDGSMVVTDGGGMS